MGDVDQISPVWRISLRMQPTVSVIGSAIHGVDRLTENWRIRLWALLLFDYTAELVVDDQVMEVHPGLLGIFPPGSELTVRYNRPSEHIYAHFGLAAGRDDEVPIPCLTDFGADVGQVRALLEAAIAAFPVEPERTERLVYSVLRNIATRGVPMPVPSGLHPGVRAAVAYIEANLHRPLNVETISAKAGLSRRQLSTLVRRQFDTTVVGYVRRRRAERARQLLTTTNLPVQIVAAQVAISDLQRFNKMMRREHGASPTAIRASTAGLGRPEALTADWAVDGIGIESIAIEPPRMNSPRVLPTPGSGTTR